MRTVTLGRTGIPACFNGFGALPIQRVSIEEAGYLLKKAYRSGINFFDTARSYSDSEEKIGLALSDVRGEIFLATKTPSVTVEGFWSDLNTSLELLKTDYIDLYQFHNPEFCPLPNDGTGLYEAMLEAKAQGKIRFIGMTNHRLEVAKKAVMSGFYDTLQFPFSYLSEEKDIELVQLCGEENVGFICMKALSGGLITHSDAAFAFLAEYDNVLPIWGVQRESELDEFISLIDNEPVLTEEISAIIARDREVLSGEFCRGCGYCLPCAAGIEIPMAARMSLLLRRAPTSDFLGLEWREKMAKIENCTHCGNCIAHCPYGLDTPSLLQRNYEDYKSFL